MGTVVSLVITDIVGSTRSWALHQAEMVEDLAAHDAAIREVVTAEGGSVFKHTGDGAMAIFGDPLAAVRAAAEVQRVIATMRWRTPEPLRVRVAVSTGSVVERDGDVFGTPVNRAARLLELCPAGGVLVDNATAALLTDSALDPLEVRPVGLVELRGLTHPEVVHAVVGPGLQARLATALGAKQITETASGHNIYLYSPALVVSGVRDVVDSVRGERRPTG